MIAIPISRVEKCIKHLKPEIDEFTKVAKNNLSKLLSREKNKLNSDETIYLTTLINEIDKIIIAPPDKLIKYQKKLGVVPKRHLAKGKKGRKPKTFKDKILDELDYEGLRKSFLPTFFNEIGIKACVYCNSQHTLTIESNKYLKTKIKTIIKAKFQADHFVSKADYPCLCISLYNFYPVCGTCNNVKSDNPISFQLYSNDINETTISKYKFEFEKGAVAKYLTSMNKSDLVVNFKDHEKPDKNKLSKGSFQDTFDIQGIYDTQIDIVEELVIKAKVYKISYKKLLIKSFSTLFTTASLSNRLLVGNYCEPTEIHKRPMAKFTQDIARQLGLIPPI